MGWREGESETKLYPSFRPATTCELCPGAQLQSECVGNSSTQVYSVVLCSIQEYSVALSSVT